MKSIYENLGGTYKANGDYICRHLYYQRKNHLKLVCGDSDI